MTKYCLETGDDNEAIIHYVDCASYDLATLLGSGRLVPLGRFDNSLAALEQVKGFAPKAVRCLECCHKDLMLTMPGRLVLTQGSIAA